MPVHHPQKNQVSLIQFFHVSNPYIAERRDWLVNPHSPRTKRFLKDQEMFGRQSPSDISRADENLEVEGDVYFTTQHIPT